MLFRMLYDEKLAQAAYLIGCQRTGEAVVIDAQRDVDRVLDLARREGLRVTIATETHIHADYLSGTRELAERCGARVCLSDMGDADWKYEWHLKKLGGGAYHHQLLHDGDVIRVGKIELLVRHAPGHTPEHVVFLVTDHGGGASEPMGVVSGDWLFVGDLGRPDLLETAAGQRGSSEPAARRLYETTRALAALPDFMQVWPAHGAGSACGKALGAVPQSTIGYERRFNSAVRVALEQDADAFVRSILAGQPDPPTYFARMKRENKTGPAVLGGLPRPAELSAPALRGLPAADAIIDTRPWPQFLAGHLPGALSIPINNAFPTLAGCYVDPAAEVTLICEPGQVDTAVRDLIHVGIDRCAGFATPATLATLAANGSLQRGEEIEVAQAADQQRGGALLLDVRNVSEFAAGHIEGAVNIAHTRLAARLDELPRDRTILVQCQSGNRSARATSYLASRGLRAVNVAGGFLAWQAAGRPVLR